MMAGMSGQPNSDLNMVLLDPTNEKSNKELTESNESSGRSKCKGVIHSLRNAKFIVFRPPPLRTFALYIN